MGYDPYRFIDEFPAAAVAELHLGGFTPEDDEATPGGTLLVDTHAHAVAEPAWDALCPRDSPLRAAAHDRGMGQRSAGAGGADRERPPRPIAFERRARERSPCARWLTFRPAFVTRSSTVTARPWRPCCLGGDPSRTPTRDSSAPLCGEPDPRAGRAIPRHRVAGRFGARDACRDVLHSRASAVQTVHR